MEDNLPHLKSTVLPRDTGTEDDQVSANSVTDTLRGNDGPHMPRQLESPAGSAEYGEPETSKNESMQRAHVTLPATQQSSLITRLHGRPGPAPGRDLVRQDTQMTRAHPSPHQSPCYRRRHLVPYAQHMLPTGALVAIPPSPLQSAQPTTAPHLGPSHNLPGVSTNTARSAGPGRAAYADVQLNVGHRGLPDSGVTQGYAQYLPTSAQYPVGGLPQHHIYRGQIIYQRLPNGTTQNIFPQPNEAPVAAGHLPDGRLAAAANIIPTMASAISRQPSYPTPVAPRRTDSEGFLDSAPTGDSWGVGRTGPSMQQWSPNPYTGNLHANDPYLHAPGADLASNGASPTGYGNHAFSSPLSGGLSTTRNRAGPHALKDTPSEAPDPCFTGFSNAPSQGEHRDEGTQPVTRTVNGVDLQYDDVGEFALEYLNPVFRPPFGDRTIPGTRESRRAHVADLILAIKQNKVIVESHDDAVIKNRWADGAQYYSAENIERQAWRILAKIIDLHQFGWVHRLEDSRTWDNILSTKDMTFQQRWSSLLALLSLSKSTCDTLLKGEKTESIIGQAPMFVRRVQHNKESNKKKAAKLRAAKLRAAKATAEPGISPGQVDTTTREPPNEDVGSVRPWSDDVKQPVGDSTSVPRDATNWAQMLEERGSQWFSAQLRSDGFIVGASIQTRPGRIQQSSETSRSHGCNDSQVIPRAQGSGESSPETISPLQDYVPGQLVPKQTTCKRPLDNENDVDETERAAGPDTPGGRPKKRGRKTEGGQLGQ